MTTSLNSLSDRERKLLRALILMVKQYIDEGDHLDNLAMSAGEAAYEVLLEYALIKLDGEDNWRVAQWTESGRTFIGSETGKATRDLYTCVTR